MKFAVTNFNYDINRMKEKHKHFEDHLLVSIIFMQLSEGKMVGHLSGLHNELRRVNNTVSLSCISDLLRSLKWMMSQSCDERDCLTT